MGVRGQRANPYRNRQERIKTQCLDCGVEMEHIHSASRKYCSNQCQRNHVLNEVIASGKYTRCNAMTWHRKNREYCCSECGINEWNGKSLTLQIDHIDGNNQNNLIENLRWLCPNCHTQTDTWGVKNVSEEGYHRMYASNRGKRKVVL